MKHPFADKMGVTLSYWSTDVGTGWTAGRTENGTGKVIT